jgi:hypothetical protein
MEATLEGMDAWWEITYVPPCTMSWHNQMYPLLIDVNIQA